MLMPHAAVAATSAQPTASSASAIASPPPEPPQPPSPPWYETASVACPAGMENADRGIRYYANGTECATETCTLPNDSNSSYHDELMQEVVALLKESRRDAATILTMSSTALPYEDYASLCESTPMAQELREHGLLDRFVWEKWPQAPALQFTAAKHTVMTRVPKPNWLGAHANTHGGSWIRGMLGASGYLRAEARSKGPVEMPSRFVKQRWGVGNALEDEKELQRKSRMNKL